MGLTKSTFVHDQGHVYITHTQQYFTVQIHQYKASSIGYIGTKGLVNVCHHIQCLFVLKDVSVGTGQCCFATHAQRSVFVAVFPRSRLFHRSNVGQSYAVFARGHCRVVAMCFTVQSAQLQRQFGADTGHGGSIGVGKARGVESSCDSGREVWGVFQFCSGSCFLSEVVQRGGKGSKGFWDEGCCRWWIGGGGQERWRSPRASRTVSAFFSSQGRKRNKAKAGGRPRSPAINVSALRRRERARAPGWIRLTPPC